MRRSSRQDGCTRTRAISCATGLVIACTAAPAGAAEVTFDQTYTTFGNHVVSIPAGVGFIDFVLIGAPGSNTSPSLGGTTILGGRGARVAGSAAVDPESTIYAVVGGTSGGRLGGFNGGGDAATGIGFYNHGGGGGGASDLRTSLGSLASRIAVAAGGGGAGRSSNPTGASAGGAGGNGFTSGVSGATGGSPSSGGAVPGGGATGAAAGSGGAGVSGGTAGTNGALGQGGTGGLSVENNPSGGGGGGGGGYYGGGGGGAGGFASSTATAGAGGGGGSSLLPAGATVSLADQGVSASIRINYEIPDTTVDSGPQGFVNEPLPTFAFSGDGDIASFECSLDEAPFAGCTSPLTLPEPLDDGRHTFEVLALNEQGNFDPTPARRTFTVDTVRPNTRVKSAPKSTRKRRAKIRFGASEPASFRCSAGGRPARPCSSAYRTPILERGRNLFRITATDRARNREAKPAKVVIRRVE